MNAEPVTRRQVVFLVALFAIGAALASHFASPLTELLDKFDIAPQYDRPTGSVDRPTAPPKAPPKKPPAPEYGEPTPTPIAVAVGTPTRLPALRPADGRPAEYPPTELTLAVTATDLTVAVVCTAPADSLVTRHSAYGRLPRPWLDDSIEILVCRGPDAAWAHHVTVACTGAWVAGRRVNHWGGEWSDARLWEPEPKVTVAAAVAPPGYRLTATIPLADLDLAGIAPGDGFHLQVVRNIGGRESARRPQDPVRMLQLFPVQAATGDPEATMFASAAAGRIHLAP